MLVSICAAKTKAPISRAITAQLICDFVFAHAKSRFSRDAAQIKLKNKIVLRYELRDEKTCDRYVPIPTLRLTRVFQL